MIGMPVEAPRLAEELAHQVVGEPCRHVEEPRVAGAAAERDRGLDEVPCAVHLVAGRQPGVLRLAGDLEVRVQVAVGELRLREQAGGPRGEGGELGAVAVGELPADGLQGLVDVGVHEHRPAIGRRRPRAPSAATRMASRTLSRFPAASSWRSARGRLSARLRRCQSCSRPPVSRAPRPGSGRCAQAAVADTPTGPAGAASDWITMHLRQREEKLFRKLNEEANTPRVPALDG